MAAILYLRAMAAIYYSGRTLQQLSNDVLFRFGSTARFRVTISARSV